MIFRVISPISVEVVVFLGKAMACHKGDATLLKWHISRTLKDLHAYRSCRLYLKGLSKNARFNSKQMLPISLMYTVHDNHSAPGIIYYIVNFAAMETLGRVSTCVKGVRLCLCLLTFNVCLVILKII